MNRIMLSIGVAALLALFDAEAQFWSELTAIPLRQFGAAIGPRSNKMV